MLVKTVLSKDLSVKVKESITWIAWGDNLGILISSIRDADLASSSRSSVEKIKIIYYVSKRAYLV